MADENENEVVETAGSVRAGAEDEDDDFGEDGLVDAAAAMDVEGGGEDGDGGVVIIGDITGTTAEGEGDGDGEGEGEGAEAEASRKRKRASTSSSSTSIMGAGLLDVTRDQLAALINAHQCKGRGRKRYCQTVVSSEPDRTTTTTTTQGQEQEPTQTTGSTPRCQRATSGAPSCGTTAACT